MDSVCVVCGQEKFITFMDGCVYNKMFGFKHLCKQCWLTMDAKNDTMINLHLNTKKVN